MNLKRVLVKNYRSCKEINLELGLMHALVGANNAGKSTILRALDFLFNPSVAKIDQESFWNGDTSLEIWIEAVFDNLTVEEQEKLKPYLRSDGTFHIARSAKIGDDEKAQGQEIGEGKVVISQHYCKPMPRLTWLQESNINGNNINEWWKEKEALDVNGKNFVEFVGGTKPNVGTWKEKAKEFVEQNLTDSDFEDTWVANPAGYAGVLKGTLPNFIYIPAVRDISDEAKVTKSNPFGQLLYAIIERVTEEQKNELSQFLISVQNRLNRTGKAERLQSIVETENRLNQLLNDYMLGELEIEFQPPTLEMLLTTPRLFVNDGFRNIVENKGHGLQRAIIFSILRCYSELITGKNSDNKQTAIFAIEEPELYMHPQAQRTIRRVFQKIIENGDQVFFATHSALLLDVAYFDEIIRVEAIQDNADDKTTVQSHVWQLPMKKMIEDIEARRPNLKGQVTSDSIRELYSHAYHPTRSEGFFAQKVILVEGATEQYSLPIYAEAIGYSLDMLNISVVDCGGKGPMDRLYRMFNELGIPCYVLFDYDSGNPDSNIIDKSKELLTMFGENPDTPTTTLIKDCVACFPHKWETDITPEISEFEKLTSEARSLLGKSCGKPLIARYIARKLTNSTPVFVPQSLKQIIEKAIKARWKKSCLESNAH
jgi:AAA15 family ATPase/GTPase